MKRPRTDVPKWLILEGWDKTGKSTVAEEMSKKLERPLTHIGAPTGRRCDQELVCIVEESYHTGAVFDRAWWSNVVYASLVPHRDVIRNTSLLWLELACADGLLIRTMCSDDKQHRLRMKQESEEDKYAHLLPPEVGNIRFANALASSRLPAYRRFVYDSATMGISELIDLIVDDAPLAFNPDICWGLGNPYTAQVCFVGDENPRGGMPWASVASGTYLMHCLSHLDWTTDDIYLTNSVSPTIEQEIAQMEANGATIIALGALANKRVREKTGATPILLPHPQYQRRFRASGRNDYVRQIKEATRFGWYFGGHAGT